jgi:hypothetical protein
MISMGSEKKRSENKVEKTVGAVGAEEGHAGNGPAWNGDEPGDLGVSERKLIRKLDFYLIPLVMCLYLFSFLDRSVGVLPTRMDSSHLTVLTHMHLPESTSATPVCTKWKKTSASRATNSRLPSLSSS